MDIDYVLLWLVLVSSLLSLLRLLALHPRPRGWIGVHVGILAATTLFSWLLPAGAGLVGGLLWLTLVLVPVRALLAMQRATLARDFRRAARCARLVSWLHPWDGYRSSPEVVAALALIDEGRFEEVAAHLDGGIVGGSSPGRPGPEGGIAAAAVSQSFRQRADWEGALQAVPLPVFGEAAEASRRVSADELVLHLRALGETGNLLRLAWVYERVDQALGRARREAERAALRAMLLAFCGRTALLEQVLAGALAGHPEDVREYWRAVALEAAGRIAEASDIYQRLAASGSRLTRAAAARRLARPPAPADIPPELAAVLERVERELDQERRFGHAPARRGDRLLAIPALVAATLAAFLAEIALGGSENPRTLLRMGALVPELVRAGEWWRLGTASFLHYGWLHLAMNMYGLWLLGPFVERSIGHARFLALYLVAGIGSMAGVVWLSGAGPAGVDILVGASGAVMGVVGANAAILLRGWWIERAPLAARRLGSVALIVLLQVAFDMMTPVVSGAAHLLGLAMGFTWTLLSEHGREEARGRS